MMEYLTKATGLDRCDMGSEFRSGPMALDTKELGRMTRLTAKESTSTPKVISTRVSGSTTRLVA